MFDLPFLDLPPMVAASGTVRVPGSKSLSNRALLLAALADGPTRLHGVLASDDTEVMHQALQTLGCEVRRDGEAWHVRGLGGRLAVHEADLHLGNAGTAMRPLVAALALLAATQGGRFRLSGVARMHERPIGDLVDALRPLGCAIDWLGRPGYPPLAIRGEPGGTLALAAPLRVRGDVSSQFLTALLLALPLVAGAAPVSVEVEGELISRPYVEVTLAMLRRFGVEVERQGWQRFTVPAGSRYRSPGTLAIEGDASSASYFVALGAIAARRGVPLRIEGVGAESVQGDIAFVDAARAMGADVRLHAQAIEVRRGRWPLAPIEMDCTAIPDAAMTLAAMALFADGRSRLTGIGSWRVKETDRIAAMAAELRKLGARTAAGDDWLEISPPAAWRAADIATYDDHRVAMCLSLAAFHPLAAAGGVPGRGTLRIREPRCVGKTFPDYFETLFDVAEADPARLPVITVDGPSASGKGTLAAGVAAALGWELLDSGALYRAAALAADADGIDPADEPALAAAAARLDLRFGRGAEAGRVWLRGREVTQALRDERTGRVASRISAVPALRQALHGLQLAFARAPGLVADGRDMGTVVFPHAALKVFLTASPAQRAERRHKQLISNGIPARIEDLRADLEARDERDRNRAVAPCRPAEDALLLDNSTLGVEESVRWVLDAWHARGPFAAAATPSPPA